MRPEARIRLPEVGGRPPTRGALVYVLVEPDSGIVCYVGQTRQPRRRLHGHLRAGRLWLRLMAETALPPEPQRYFVFPGESRPTAWRARPSREPRELEEWLALLAHERKAPLMRCIERVACRRGCGCTFVTECRRAGEREAWWIDRLLRKGYPLLNRTLPRRPRSALSTIGRADGD